MTPLPLGDVFTTAWCFSTRPGIERLSIISTRGGVGKVLKALLGVLLQGRTAVPPSPRGTHPLLDP